MQKCIHSLRNTSYFLNFNPFTRKILGNLSILNTLFMKKLNFRRSFMRKSYYFMFESKSILKTCWRYCLFYKIKFSLMLKLRSFKTCGLLVLDQSRLAPSFVYWFSALKLFPDLKCVYFIVFFLVCFHALFRILFH